MDPQLAEAEQALGRMLANGPLTAVPKRTADQRLLAVLAAARFEPGRDYGEAEVNAALAAWLGTFCEPHGIDHVTLRRMIVDARLLRRTASGSAYGISPGKADEVRALAGLDPASVLAQARSRRESRKARHAT